MSHSNALEGTLAETRSIEDIVLQKDTRGISALRPHLPENFVTEAAEFILEHPKKALIVTGFYVIYGGAPETDGPPGAVAIGNALVKLGYGVAHVTDKWSLEMMEAVAPSGQPVIEFPVTGHTESADFARELLAREAPSVLISIERCGLTGDGTFRNSRGMDISEYNAKIDHLFTQHPFSVGIGDGGNEIGMGNHMDVIPSMDRLPDNPCVTGTTKLIVASVSNWGGFGLAAALSLLKGQNLLPGVDEAEEWVRTTVRAGAVEGMTGERKDWVDGRPPHEDSVCLRDLHALLAARGL